MVVLEGVARRDEWPELPEPVREAVADRLGGTVVSAVNQRAGYSHGMASALALADGRRVFAKAVRGWRGYPRWPRSSELSCDAGPASRSRARHPT
ncbi:hypothetical protein KHQ06_20575 [Nocardia tengchongensis]|uniref:Uncharacterized protein n=1 Tax=Nocardia tengchongensis TaxID=2055889 RepID=A0ABX8CZT4_9NOCA|nr:hypothetical protein [Nocardia tengchongensis]QVI25417.1 hypothetical protein KHQ06_20575 [Nocardia tengchongensis]